MKKILAALLVLCTLFTTLSALGDELLTDEIDIPSFSELYPGTAVYLRLFSEQNKESRRQATAGPGDFYATAGAYKPYKQRGVTAFFACGDYVLVHLQYQTVDDRYLYFKRTAFDKLPNVPEMTELAYFEGTALCQMEPSWGPGSQYSTESEYVIYARTPVKVFFEENGYVYAEFQCAKGTVRMWLPKAQVNVEPQTLDYPLW